MRADRVRHAALAVLSVALMSACASQPAATVGRFVQGKGTQALAAGVAQFENGQYAEATRSLQSALELGLNLANDEARAHKYLAFMHCASNRLPQCREAFARALSAAPELELEPSEAGHPVWGPAFRTVKARR
jgi:Tfp pilus assembly protein PilF